MRPRTLQQLRHIPIRTLPNVTHYEWAGSVLQKLLKTPQPVAESWPFFSGPSQPARIAGGTRMGMTMAELVSAAPDVLGPEGIDPQHHGQKYFFVKVLDPSDFPAFAYVGFRPKAIRALKLTSGAFRQYVASLLWQDRQLTEALADFVRPHLHSRHRFEAFKAAYKRWAIAESLDDWSGTTRTKLLIFMAAAQRSEGQRVLRRQSQTRRRIVHLMHRMAFRPGQAILIPSTTLHAIAGLSLQLHPNTPGNCHPKDEVWMYREIPLTRGTRGWLLVEPQRTFDRTESGADFFTPFAWEEDPRGGRLRFRKPMTQAYLQKFVRLMDVTPKPKTFYLRMARPISLASASVQGGIRWYRTVDERTWPFFFVYELHWSGAGMSTVPLGHRSFSEVHVTYGRVNVVLNRHGGGPYQTTVTPASPLFLPATLPYDTITYRAHQPAHLCVVSRGAHRL